MQKINRWCHHSKNIVKTFIKIIWKQRNSIAVNLQYFKNVLHKYIWQKPTGRYVFKIYQVSCMSLEKDEHCSWESNDNDKIEA